MAFWSEAGGGERGPRAACVLFKDRVTILFARTQGSVVFFLFFFRKKKRGNKKRGAKCYRVRT